MKKGKFITIVSIFLLIVGLFSTLILDYGIASRIVEVVTVITAVVGAIALYLQFRRDKNINEASFLLEFWKNFSEVYFPHGFAVIGKHAFGGQKNLKTLHFGERTYIEDNAFECCTSLESVNLDGCSLGSLSFCHCKNLKEIDLEKGVITIDQSYCDCGKYFA